MSEVQIGMMEGPQRQLSSSHTPSFSSYSSETLAQIAARVIRELSLHDDTLYDSWEEQNGNNNFRTQSNHHLPNENDDDFEFAFVSTDVNSSPVSADDIFHNGQIRPTYPLFDRNLLNDDVVPTTNVETADVGARRRRLPLRKLMFEEERETGWCSSLTSEADESNKLNGVAEESYCLWTPPAKNKSKSMGSSSSKRWKLRDLLLRSHSDGKKEPLLFVGPTKHPSDANGGAVPKGKRKSLLPYRHELVGIFNNGNGLGRNY